MLSKRLTLLIPAYNEGSRLPKGFARIEIAASENRFSLDDLTLTYVDDGSSDETARAAESLIADIPAGNLIRLPENRGKGAAIRAGVVAASTPFLAFTDADLAIDPRQLPALVAALDLVPFAIGSRSVAGHIGYGSPLRTAAGRAFNWLIRHLSRIQTRDTQCGFKALRTAHAKILFHFATIVGFAFDVELLARANWLGWKVEEVPVSWQDVQGSHVRLAADSFQMVRELLWSRRNFNSLRPLYGVRTTLDEWTNQTRDSVLPEVLSLPTLRSTNGHELTVLAAMSSKEEAERLFSSHSILENSPVEAIDPQSLRGAAVDRIFLLSEVLEEVDQNAS